MHTIIVTQDHDISPDKTATLFRKLGGKRSRRVESIAIDPPGRGRREATLRVQINGDYRNAIQVAADITEVLGVDWQDSIRIEKATGDTGATTWKQTLREVMDRQGIDAPRLAASFAAAVSNCQRSGIPLPESEGDLSTRIRKWRASSQSQLPSSPDELALLIIALDQAGAWANEDPVVQESTLIQLEAIRPSSRQARIRLLKACRGLAKA